MTKVMAVIVSYNGEAWIGISLLSLRSSWTPIHVIVVDNASTDDTVSIVRNEFPEVELILNETNTGFGGGNNVGIIRAIEQGSEYILLLNQDAYVTSTTVGELVEFMDSHPEFGVASPIHCSPTLDNIDRKTYLGYLQTYAADFLCDAALGKRADHYRVHGINAAAWMIRTSVLERTGGFDPIFFMYGEDDDLLERFAWHNVPFALIPRSRIVHLRAPTVSIEKPRVSRNVSQAHVKLRSQLTALIKRPD